MKNSGRSNLLLAVNVHYTDPIFSDPVWATIGGRLVSFYSYCIFVNQNIYDINNTPGLHSTISKPFQAALADRDIFIQMKPNDVVEVLGINPYYNGNTTKFAGLLAWVNSAYIEIPTPTGV